MFRERVAQWDEWLKLNHEREVRKQKADKLERTNRERQALRRMKAYVALRQRKAAQTLLANQHVRFHTLRKCMVHWRLQSRQCVKSLRGDLKILNLMFSKLTFYNAQARMEDKDGTEGALCLVSPRKNYCGAELQEGETATDMGKTEAEKDLR